MFTEAEIRAALENNEFFLEYLPTISLSDERCVGGEALIRWRKGDRIVPPMEFIPQVEGTLLSGLITYWVVEHVAEEFGNWLRDTENVHIGINVPPEVWGRGGIEYAARKSHVYDLAHKFVLEVSERGIPDKIGVDTINNHGHSNVLIALDDVLSREAHLLVLARLKVDIIKIDKSFANRILRDDWPTREDTKILAVCSAAEHLVIFEGVEKKKQVDVLKAAGIRFVQGWYFSRSLPAEEFRSYISAHS